jgi:hypothetical protein
MQLWKHIITQNVRNMRKIGMSFTIPQTRKFLTKKITMFSPFIIDECIVLKLNQEEFEDTKGVIIIQKSKKNRQHNGQKKKY